MPLQGILNTARTLSFYTRKQEVTANNLANASSDAFKADRVLARAVPGSTAPVAVQDIDMRQGAMRETGRSLDVALEGPGFLTVKTPQGPRLTRGGSFRLDAEGRLTDQQGNPVLTANGPVVVQGGAVEIQGDGTIVVDGSNAGKLLIVDLNTPGKLLKEGFGRYTAPGGTHPVDESGTHVRQGAVEDANLDSMLSMVDLVTIQRAFAANIDALKAMDSVLGAVTNEVGKVV
jgi:flagellar basal body rod protein FlgG